MIHPWIRPIWIDWLALAVWLLNAIAFVLTGAWWTLPILLFLGNRWAKLHGWTLAEAYSVNDEERAEIWAKIAWSGPRTLTGG